MGVTVVTSSASHQRIAHGHEWLKVRAAADEILIIGATLGAANDLARGLAQEKRAALFGYHRLTLGQLASALARPVLTAQQSVPPGVWASKQSRIAQFINCPRLADLAVIQDLQVDLGSAVRSRVSSLN